MSNPANSTPAQPPQVMPRTETDAHGRVWHRPHAACYVSKAVRLDVDHYAPHRVDLSVDSVWMEDFADVAEAQAWVAKVAAEPKPGMWERLWAWVAL